MAAEVSKSGSKREAKPPLVYFLGGYHPVNESYIRSPPSNVRLESRVSVRAFDDFRIAGDIDPLWKSTKRLADFTFRLLNQPRIVPVLRRCDLIHTNGSIIPASFTPWIANVENPSAFYGFNEKWFLSKSMKKRLAGHLLSRRCRAILPYSEASKKYLLICLQEWKDELESKIQVVYPAIDRYLVRTDRRTRMPGETLKFLFVGNHFFDKGGREAVRAFRHVREIGQCELNIVSAAPEHQRREFREILPILKKERGVKFHLTGVRRHELMEMYRSSDVFVFPSYMDQVPFVLFEAMAAGLPVIGSNVFAVPEQVLDGINGLIVKSPIVAFPTDKLRTREHLDTYMKEVMNEKNFDGVVDQLIEKMTLLLTNSQLRDRFRQGSLDMVTSGRFSTQSRNAILGRIYEESLSSSPLKEAF